MTEAGYKYWAFISYSHADEAWAKWLHQSIETYRVPRHLVGRTIGDEKVPRRLFPVFRDRDELPSSHELGAVINRALAASRNLVVICSPRSATSRWVNEEIKAFRALGRSHRVFCLIVDGEPHASARPDIAFSECFPPALREEGFEPIAADARERKDGKAASRLKLLAGLIDVGYDELKQREKQRQRRRLVINAAAGLALLGVLGGIVQGFMAQRANREREIRIEQLVENGRLELLEGRQARAAVFLNEALKLGHDTVPLRFMLGQAMLAVDALTPVRVKHGGGHVRKALFSPDGTRFVLIVETGDSAVAKVYDAATGAELIVLEDVPAFPRVAQFLPDGKRLLVSGVQQSSALSHAETGPKTGLWSLTTSKPLLLTEGNAGRSAQPLDPAGRALAIAGATGVEIWNLEQAQRIQHLAPQRTFSTVSFSPDGKVMASADSTGQVELWATSPFKVQASLSGLEGQVVEGLTFTPDGSRVFGFSSYGDVRVWDVQQRKQVLSFAVDPAWVNGIRFSANGRRVLTIGSEGYKVWSAARGVLLFHLPLADLWYADAALSADGNFLHTADTASSVTEIWSVRSRRKLHSLDLHTGGVTAVALDPDGRRLLVASVDGTAEIWNASINPTLGIELKEDAPYSIQYTDKDRALMVAGGSYSRGRTVFLDAETGAERKQLVGHESFIRSASTNAAGNRLITGSADGTGILWDVDTQQAIATLDHKPAMLNLVDFSPDGSRIVTATYSSAVGEHRAGAIWDAGTGQHIADLMHARPIFSFSFDPAGQRLITASEDGTLKLWSVTNGQLLNTFSGHKGPVLTASFDSTGTRIISAGQDDSVRLWDADTATTLKTLEDPAVGWGLHAIFSPDGKTAAIGTRGGNIWLWRFDSGELKSLKGHLSDALSLQFLHRGRLLVSRSQDGTVRAWDPIGARELSIIGAPAGTIAAMDVRGDEASLAAASQKYFVGVWSIALESRDTQEVATILDCHTQWSVSGTSLTAGRNLGKACDAR